MVSLPFQTSDRQTPGGHPFQTLSSWGYVNTTSLLGYPDNRVWCRVNDSRFELQLKTSPNATAFSHDVSEGKSATRSDRSEMCFIPATLAPNHALYVVAASLNAYEARSSADHAIWPVTCQSPGPKISMGDLLTKQGLEKKSYWRIKWTVCLYAFICILYTMHMCRCIYVCITLLSCTWYLQLCVHIDILYLCKTSVCVSVQ